MRAQGGAAPVYHAFLVTVQLGLQLRGARLQGDKTETLDWEFTYRGRGEFSRGLNCIYSCRVLLWHLKLGCFTPTVFYSAQAHGEGCIITS